MSSDTKLFTVDKFLGLNEAADGYTELKMGEASNMVNFLVTDGYNLTTRNGIQRIDFEEVREPAEIVAAWSGFVGGRELLIVVDYLDGTDRIWIYEKKASGGYQSAGQQAGELNLTEQNKNTVKIFSFAGTVYIMSAGNTLVWNEDEFVVADIYVPLVMTGAAPAGGGTTLEGINLLTPLRRIEYSADGTAKEYVLPEEAVNVVGVEIDNIPLAIETLGTFHKDNHTFTFNVAPEKGVGNVEFVYTADEAESEKSRLRIASMKLVEAYNGSTDTRLFMAGDGSNICYYSGVPMNGDLKQLYFPGMNEVAVDMSGSPVTGLQRHYSKLLVFKPDGTYTITYEPVTLTDGSLIAGFYLRAANREFGNEVMGQVQTVNNYPRTITKGGVYEWRITSSYYQDERYAKRVSDRVQKTLDQADMSKVVTCDDDHSKTYYIFLNDEDGTVLVNRYALGNDGVWCIYRSNLCRNVRYAMMNGGAIVFGTDTELFYFDEFSAKDAPEIRGGESQAIKAVWESGYMDFGMDFRRKYASLIYVSMLPEASSSLTVTASTDKRESYREKVIGSNLFSFTNMDFSRFSFDMNRTPKIRRVRLKVKKFVYYKLIFKVEDPGTQATVLSFDQQVRFSSMAK